ncbi:MAG: M1 family metallopeptidase [Bifidobacteriaceae bacterium]|jgi:aminopeptidase N|nr:M1 family metallopeptidase [Bifidobacteriaceae bacterium]
MTTLKHGTDYLIPNNYSLQLTIDAKNKEFFGTVILQGTLTELGIKEHFFLVHADELSIKNVTVNNENAEFSAQENNEIHISIDGSESEIELKMDFSGKVNQTIMNGLYLCKYKGGEIFATQFESHYARKAFPCIDEPAGKATFDVAICVINEHSDSYKVISNMPETSVEKNENGDLIHTFDKTPKMSPYLLAFAAGNFNEIKSSTKSGTEVSVMSSPIQPLSQLEYALDTAVKSLEFYEDFYATPYPLPRSIHLALPDFSAGAMENWGLITYRETALLCEVDAPINQRRRVATVVAHELAHQWFGNLVTMKWWDELWLNESFANLMEYICTDAIHTELKIWDDYEITEPNYALSRDRLEGVQSVQQIVSHPDEISTLFDGAIVYAKGGRLLKMIWKMLGTSQFQSGLKSYFEKYHYSNTTGKNLWDCLGDWVEEFINPWLNQSGFPLITASIDGEKITINQECFGYNAEKNWTVPLFSNIENVPELLAAKSADFNIDSKSFDNLETLPFNSENVGHYIVSYDDTLWSKIIDNFDNYNDMTKLQILSEQAVLSASGYTPISRHIELLKLVKNETNAAVFDSAIVLIGGLQKFAAANENLQPKINRFISTNFLDLFSSLSAKYLQDSKSLNIDEQQIFASLIKLYAKYDPATISPSLASILNSEDVDSLILSGSYIYKCSTNSVGEYTELLDLYKNTNDAYVRLDIQVGLCSAKTSDKISKLLEFMLDHKNVRQQDIYSFVAQLLSGNNSRYLTWTWMKDNWNWIDDTFANDKSLDMFPRYAGNRLITVSEQNEFLEFFSDKKDNISLNRSILVAEKEIAANIKWVENEMGALEGSL